MYFRSKFFSSMVMACLISSFSPYTNAQQDAVSLTKTGSVGVEWQLQVHESSLESIFNEVMLVSGISIHYSALPIGLYSSTCVGSSIEIVLKCLLGNDLNLVFQYLENEGEFRKSLVSVWVLNSKVDITSLNKDCQRMDDIVHVKSNVSLMNSETMKHFLLLFRKGSPNERARSLADLITNGNLSPKEMDELLYTAMGDDEAIVREQALFGMVKHYDEKKANTELQRALQDPESSVRMKVVEYSNNPALLLQASVDDDESVRWLAKYKLQEENEY